ncbi:MAG TPA: NAD(P)-dependent oxidoreductase [Ktedonobacterales bacterium]|nr:NAD(P)-dependent oxidoreductase [Ktedonobacterales bacterium]
MPTVGFVGLGAMGGRVTKRLLDAGYSVTGYNRTPAKAQWLVDAGMRLASSPREVVEASDIIFSMVTNTQALEAVIAGPDGIMQALGPGKTYIDMSTVSPAVSRRVAEQVEAYGAQMLDAPVSGSVVTLEQGKLSMMIGGRREVYEAALPTLRAIAPKVQYVGSHGQAVLMKIAINLNLQAQILAFSEALLLAEKGGIAREDAMQALLDSVIASPSLQYRAPFILHAPDEVWFNVNMMQKDMLLALEMGRELNVPLPMVSVSNEFLTAARAQGLAGHDFYIVFQVLAKMAGVERPADALRPKSEG